MAAARRAADTVRFKQVDVFTSVPFKGNPLAVVFDADALSDADMLAIARWTNLSETAFLVAPSDPAADYRVRIFTTGGELPFAGHPTLGAAHAFLDAGAQPKAPGRLVQQCGAGLVELAKRDGGWAFAAPSARVTPLAEREWPALAAALRTGAIDFGVPPGRSTTARRGSSCGSRRRRTVSRSHRTTRRSRRSSPRSARPASPRTARIRPTARRRSRCAA